MQRTLEVAIKCVEAAAPSCLPSSSSKSIVSMLEVVPFMFDLLLVILLQVDVPKSAWASVLARVKPDLALELAS